MSTVDMTEEPDLLPPPKPKGAPCGPQDSCATGFCVDGVCCDSACTEACGACDVANFVGTCSAVTGLPHASRVCPGQGTLCGGTCDGQNKSACAFPSTSVICGATCNGKCDGAGACSSTTPGMCPNGFGCGMTGCLTSCTKDADCASPYFKCSAPPQCVRIVESDCLDGRDNNGDGLIDCADPTCISRGLVQCVPVPPAGDEIGIVTTAACPANYATAEVQHQGLSSGTCGQTCSCDMGGTCSSYGYAFTGANCSGSSTMVPTATFGSQYCEGLPNQAYRSTQFYEYLVAGTAMCNRNGSSAMGSSSWTTTTNFCAATKTSMSCADAAHVCVGTITSTKECTRVPAANASCPGGYTTGTRATYYGDYAPGSCSCTCGSPQGTPSCGSPVWYGYSDSCNTGNGAFGPIIYSATSGSCFDFATINGQTPSVTLAAVKYNNQGLSVSCAVPTYSVATQSMATNGSTICCQ